jgi:quercetin dioxygenase-like cupin family protein
MKKPHLCFRAYLAALLMLATVPAQAADVKELFAIDLADYAGKEGRVIEVSYPPGAQDVVHRHDAHAFVYVLEGQIVMQLKGKPAVTLKAGQTFYEGPTDVHVVGRNTSNTDHARFVVVLLKGKGAPIFTPVKE